MAFIYWHRRLKSRFSDPTCVDQNEQVSCFDEENVCKAEIEDIAFTACAGLRTTAIIKGSLISAEYLILVPLIDLHEYMNRTLLSQKIIGVCPRCYYRGTPFIRKKACYRRVRTQRHGWPLEFKICEHEIKVDRDECGT
ncbi:unnamed protein product [Toxocara canis]|nr:unnamed protein product [Toxocara canis]